MAILNYALLSALLPSVLAAPGLHGRGIGHGPYVPSGKVFPSGFPQPSGTPGPYPYHSSAPVGTAPFPAQNATATGISTGGSGPVVTIQSTINLVPVPITDTLYSAGQSPESTGAAGPGEVGSPASSGAPGVGGSGAPGSPAATSPGSGAESPATGTAGSGPGGVGSSPTGAPGAPGSGVEAGTCGPAIVTVTQAQTVTVTVPAGSNSGAPGAPGAPGSGPGESPGQSAPGAPEGGPSSAPTFSAPFPIGNSSASAGPTGSGSVVVSTAAGVPTLHHPVPLPAHSVAPVVNSPAPAVVSSPAPSEVATSAAPVTASSVPVQALYHVQGQDQHQPASQQSSVTFAAPQAQAATTSAPQAPAQAVTTSAPQAPAQAVTTSAPQAPSQAPTSAGPSSSPAPKSSPVKSSGGVKARGLLYGSLGAAESFDTSNIGWGWDWDSSPSPASGKATGSLSGIQFVPMLLSTEGVHTSLWEGNSAGAEWVMGFNEPDQCGGGGSCMSVSDVVSGWGTYFSGLSASKCSPATTNDLTTQGKGLSYMSEFLAACTGCKFDALAFHYYGSGSDTSALTNTIQAYQKLQKQYGIPELWIPEMAPTDQPSADEVNAILAILDNPANGVTRYAFNGLNTGSGIQLAGEIASAYCS